MSTKPDTAEELARRVLELDKSATPAPWVWNGDRLDGPGADIITTDSGYYGPHGDDAVLIPYYREAAPTLARAYLELQRRIDEAPTYWAVIDESPLLAPELCRTEERARDSASPTDTVRRVALVTLPDKETE